MLRTGCIIAVLSTLVCGVEVDIAEAVNKEVIDGFSPTVALQSAATDDGPSDIVLFIGRFHPLLVHLPIGFLLLAFLLEFCGRFERFKDLGTAVSFSLLLGGLSAIGAAGTGYLLSMDGGYGEGILSTHMWLGIAVVLLSLAAFVLRQWYYEKPRLKKVYTGLLGLMILCLMGAGHYGGSLTHGSDYLLQYMPAPLRSMAGLPPKKERGIKKIENLDSAKVFKDIIHPILDTRCTSCHNPKKKKGELLLTTYEELMKGGESGPPLKTGHADSSDIVHRLLLPEADDDHMPPEGKLQLTSDQIDLISWWIDQGAPMDHTVSELEISEGISDALNKLTVEGTSFLAKTEVPKADTAVVNKLRRRGIQVSSIAQKKNFLQAKYPESADSVNLELLIPISEQLTWLDLAKTAVTDSVLSRLAEFKNMTRLNLENTNIGDSGIKVLGTLEHLEYLNIYNTNISDKGLQYLEGNKSLKSLYAWQTNVTQKGVDSLKQQLPELYIDTGWQTHRQSGAERDSSVIGS